MEEDHEELLQYTDDESLSETEDQCCSVDKTPKEHYLLPYTFFHHTKLEFFTTLILLILSSVTILIVLPLYINTINMHGNVFSLILFNIPLSTLILLITILVWKFLCNKFKNLKVTSLPITFWKLLQISFIYITCGILYIYSSDRNRVPCHLQDPVKGIVLVFSLLFYFFFCRNFMGLRRIFSTTTVIVGLFIAVDYGLCDEFVCRGYDRQQVPDDAGPWSWKAHSTWTGLYIFGLTLFAAFFTLLDRHVAPDNEEMSHNIISTSFVNTISRSVTASTSNLIPSEPQEHDRQGHTEFPKSKSALHFALWIHIFGLGIVLLTFWVDFIPGIGKGATVAESLNNTMQGIVCHFTKPGPYKHETDSCGNVFWYMLVFQLAYIVFIVASIKLLMLSQSAVFTVATTSFALPLIGIWWSLFHATPAGLLVWSPKIRGEFVCSVLGLPIVSVALGFLCVAHFEDSQKYLNTRRLLSRRQSA